jgi:uncharacterized membrane protein (DUF4010 family)
VFLAASMGVLIVAGRLIADRFGATGTVASAAAMGLFDVDAMTVSMVRLVPTSIAQTSAAWAVLVGVASNTLTKVIIASAVGRGRFAVSVTAASVICIVAALITMLATLAIFS